VNIIKTTLFKNIYIRIFLAGLFIATGIISWHTINKKTPAASYQTATVERGDIENNVTAVGILQPFQYVDVGAQVSGQLKRLKVKVGDKIKKGDLLAEIDPAVYMSKLQESIASLDQLKAQLKMKEAQLLLAKQQHSRNEELLKNDAIAAKDAEITGAGFKTAQAETDAIKAQIKQSEAAVETAKTNLGYTKIIAPMSGMVVSLTAREGQTLNANQQAPVILRIADTDTMTVWAQVSEADVTKLSVGRDAYFTVLGQSKQWDGKLRQILPTPENINNVIFYDALFDVPNPRQELKVQMTAQVFFVIEKSEDTLVIPLSALQTPDKKGKGKGKGQKQKKDGQAKSKQVKFTVRILKQDGTPEDREVTIGVMNAISAEILSGLQEDEIVVTGTASAQNKKGGLGKANKGGKL